jgi:hypothetical protein
MNLKRTVYHIAGKDYEATQIIEFTFFVQRVSVHNFLNIEPYANFSKFQVRHIVKHVGNFFADHIHTTTDGLMKPIVVRCSAETLCLIFEKLGIKEWNSVDALTLYVRKGDLRAYDGYAAKSYNGISVFDPKTKKSWLTSGAPKKIIGRQAIINGKLWRKYLSK